MSTNRNDDTNELREELKDEYMAAYFGGGNGAALMEALEVDDDDEDTLEEKARSMGIRR